MADQDEISSDSTTDTATDTTTISPESEPGATPVKETAPAPQVVVVDAPVPPRKKGNRGLSVLLALFATLLVESILVGLALVLPLAPAGFLTDPSFYYPAPFVFIGLVLVGVVLNRASWWTHIAGSVVVGLLVWFGTASLTLVAAGVLSMTQQEANAVFYAALFSPLAIVAALVAREVAVWVGAILARRGRRLVTRNAEAYAAYERERDALIPPSAT